MIKPGNIWHSPTNVYWHIQKLSEKVDAKSLETRREYQMVREARVGAVVALAMFKKLGKPTYIQLYKPDPPDLILMQQNGVTKDITQVEVTRYAGEPKETILEQLKRKDPQGFHKYSENYILVVNLGIGMKVDFEPVRDYLNSNKTPFPVWVVQEKSNYPDTIARLVIVNPKIYEMEINIGEAAHIFDSLKLPGVIHSKRVGNPKLVRAESIGDNYEAPWNTIGK